MHLEYHLDPAEVTVDVLVRGVHLLMLGYHCFWTLHSSIRH